MEDHTPADHTAAVDDYIGMENRSLTHLHIGTNEDTGIKDDLSVDPGPGTDIDAGIDHGLGRHAASPST
jgi:hypothetical protein